MIIINTLSSKYFEYNGVAYNKLYQPLRVNTEHVSVYNVYDTKQQLINSSHYSEYVINGVTYNNQATVIEKLLPVILAGNTSEEEILITSTSDIINDGDGISQFSTINDLQDFITIDDIPSIYIPTNLSEFNNNTNFITIDDVIIPEVIIPENLSDFNDDLNYVDLSTDQVVNGNKQFDDYIIINNGVGLVTTNNDNLNLATLTSNIRPNVVNLVSKPLNGNEEYIQLTVEGLIYTNAEKILGNKTSTKLIFQDVPTIGNEVVMIPANKSGTIALLEDITNGNYITNENLPTHTSDLINDSGFITLNDVELPTHTSELINDSGYITINDVELPTHTSDIVNDSGYITINDVPEVTIPSNLSEFNNDSAFINTVDDETISGEKTFTSTLNVKSDGESDNIATFDTTEGGADLNIHYGYNGVGWNFTYVGSGNGNDNSYELWSDVGNRVYKATQDGNITFDNQLQDTVIIEDADGVQLGVTNKIVLSDALKYNPTTNEISLNNKAIKFTDSEFLNGWINYVGWENASYSVTGDVVTLNGLIRFGTSHIMLQLPNHIKPKASILTKGQDSDNNIIRINIGTSGIVSITGTYTNSWVSLSGITYNINN